MAADPDMRLRPPTVDELEADWLTGRDCTMSDGLLPPFENPEAVWQAVLRVLQRELTEDQVALLAAGPLEDLLARYGVQFIERVEAEAKQSPALAHLLGGVWRQGMPPEIWHRVETARAGQVW